MVPDYTLYPRTKEKAYAAAFRNHETLSTACAAIAREVEPKWLRDMQAT